MKMSIGVTEVWQNNLHSYFIYSGCRLYKFRMWWPVHQLDWHSAKSYRWKMREHYRVRTLGHWQL